MRIFSLTAALVLCAAAVVSPTHGRRQSANKSANKVSAVPVAPCDVGAYVNDPDPRGMNVRSGPGGGFPVVGNLPNARADGIGVHITGWSGDWARIDSAVEQGADEEKFYFRGEGWVYAPLLAVDGQGGFGGGTPLYRGPAEKGRVVARVPVEGGGAKLRGCRGRWAQVEYKGVRGWAAPDTLCTSGLTNCN